jgi:rfaE bifunctional protein kinase chain/domain
MNSSRFASLTGRFSQLKLALVGDFCLDRYLEIDPAKAEISLETGLPVHNVVRVRSQPGGAGTILNNLVALGVGTIFPVGFCGQDGEGYELLQALRGLAGVRTDHFVQTPERRTFTYCKPLVIAPGQPPVELNRLDSKNWTATPRPLADQLAASVAELARQVNAFVLLEQVDQAETGVITSRLLQSVERVAAAARELVVLADSRRGLQNYPPVCLKMNRAELARLVARPAVATLDEVKSTAQSLARSRGRSIFVTLAEDGMLGASPDGEVVHVPALPRRGEIDIVGAGDAVSANLACALAAGATLTEALEMANAAASIVIHQLGTTGTARVLQIRELLNCNPTPA